MAVEIDGCEMFACSEASVMLPVSPAAMKYSRWRNVNFMMVVHSRQFRRAPNAKIRSTGRRPGGLTIGECTFRPPRGTELPGERVACRPDEAPEKASTGSHN